MNEEPEEPEHTSALIDLGAEVEFAEGLMVGRLLTDDYCFVNQRNAGDCGTTVVVLVNANDVMAWACADAEPLPLSEVPAVYMAAKLGGAWIDRWICLRRGEKPQKPVADTMRAAGAWTADVEALKDNHYDAWCRTKAAEDKP